MGKNNSGLKLTTVDCEKLLKIMLDNYDKMLIGAIRIGVEVGLRESNQI